MTHRLRHETARVTQIRILSDQTVIAGSEDGRVFIWPKRQLQAITLGQHEGAIIHLAIHPSMDQFISMSSTQAYIWHGPFDAESIRTQLQKQVKTCLTVHQRMKWFNESKVDAESQVRQCRKLKN